MGGGASATWRSLSANGKTVRVEGGKQTMETNEESQERRMAAAKLFNDLARCWYYVNMQANDGWTGGQGCMACEVGMLEMPVGFSRHVKLGCWKCLLGPLALRQGSILFTC